MSVLFKNVRPICFLSVLCVFFQCGPVGLSTLWWSDVRRTLLSYPMRSRRPDHVKVVRRTLGASFLFFQCGPVRLFIQGGQLYEGHTFPIQCGPAGLTTLRWSDIRWAHLSYSSNVVQCDCSFMVDSCTKDTPFLSN